MNNIVTGLRQANAQRWANARLTRDFSAVAHRLVDPIAKARYVTVEKKTGVPWFLIAVIHERESGQNWYTHLGQGDPLNKPTRHVPFEPAFATWEEGAVDALVNCEPYAARNKDWSVGSALTILEQYNGLAYALHGVPSPYIWSGTNQYTRGKVLVDHGPIEPVVDVQLGCAGLILDMMDLDRSISFESNIPMVQVEPSPSITNPKPGSIGASIKAVWNSLFGRKANV